MASPLKFRKRSQDLKVDLLGPNRAKELPVRPDLPFPELIEVLVVGIPPSLPPALFDLGYSCRESTYVTGGIRCCGSEQRLTILWPITRAVPPLVEI